MNNYDSVIHQMTAFGIEFQDRDLPLRLDTPKRVTCGAKGKCWYRLYTFRPDSGGSYVTGVFGTYKHGGSQDKVQVDWKPLSDAERDRLARERAAARAAAQVARREQAEQAALGAMELWRKASNTGKSPYLAVKGLEGESCRYLPDGSLLIPMLRYDLPRADALQAVQRIWPGPRKHWQSGEDLPQKTYTKGFEKPGCAVRLGAVEPSTALILVCEGYATGLSIRLALERRYPVFVAFDAGNLMHVVPMIAALHRTTRLLICADDDWLTKDQHTGALVNPGRSTARAAARNVAGCDIVWPIFKAATREAGDTDFDDLRMREGIDRVRDQLSGVCAVMARLYG